jgi:hypothetical protein
MAGNELYGAKDNVFQVDPVKLEFAFAREIEQPPDNISGPINLLINIGKELVYMLNVSIMDIFQENLAGSGDIVKRVVELVGNSRG